MTKEQLEALARKIEQAEQKMQAITSNAAINLRAFTAEENTQLAALVQEREGLVAVMRAAQALPAPSAPAPSQPAPAAAAATITAPAVGQQIQERAEAAGQPRVDVTRHDPKDEKPFNNLGEQLRAITLFGRYGEDDERLRKVHNIHEHQRAATGMGEVVPSDGGFLLQKDFSNMLQGGLFETSLLLKQTKQLPLSSNSNGIEVVLLDETSRASGSRLGGVQVYWGNEADAPSASKPKIRLFKMELLKMFAACYLTEELIQDAVALGAFASDAFRNEMGFVIDDMIIRGNGAGRPSGLLDAAANPALVTQAIESGPQTTDTFNFQNALKMRARTPARSRKNLRWFINQEVETQLPQFTLLGGTSSPGIYIPGGSVVDGIPMDRLMGHPVQVIEQCSALGDLGDVLLADLSEYLTISKGGLQAASSIHVRFLQGENCLRFMQRWNGAPLWHSAITPYKGANTISPYVTLAAR